MQHSVDPTAFVDDWIRRNIKNKPKKQMSDVFTCTIDDVWRRCFTTLGEITLSAIFDRVFFIARRSFPWLGSFTVRTDEIIFDSIDTQNISEAELENGIRRVIEELLKVIGSLTGGALTPQLFDVLKQTNDTEAKDQHTGIPQSPKDKSEGEI